MNDSTIKTVIGGAGIVTTEIVEKLPPLQPEEITSIGNLLIQIVIGVVTLFGLLKRKPK